MKTKARQGKERVSVKSARRKSTIADVDDDIEARSIVREESSSSTAGDAAIDSVINHPIDEADPLIVEPGEQVVDDDDAVRPSTSATTDNAPNENSNHPQLSVIGVDKITSLGWSSDELATTTSIIRESHTRSALAIKLALGNRTTRSVDEIQQMLDCMQAMIDEEDLSRMGQEKKRRDLEDWLDVITIINNRSRHRDLSHSIYQMTLRQAMLKALKMLPNSNDLTVTLQTDGVDSTSNFSLDRLWEYFFNLFAPSTDETPAAELTDVERRIMQHIYDSMDVHRPSIHHLIDDVRQMANAYEEEDMGNEDVKMDAQIDDVTPNLKQPDWPSMNPFEIPLTKLETIKNTIDLGLGLGLGSR